jgi:polyhydroxybutyrate depolymerase
MRFLAILISCCAVIAATAARAGAVAPLQTFQSGERDRSYRVYRPPSLSWKTPVPLVVMLHGGFGASLEAESGYHWDAAADEHGFVVLYPDGFERSWNAGACCGPAMRQNVDDVAFLTALIEHVRSAGRIDPERIYVTGISNGAMMAYRLACESSLRLAAIGPVAGTLEVPCEGASPTSVLAIHGLDDRHVPFRGGMPSAGVERSPRRAVPEVVALWRKTDDCGAAVVQKDGSVTTDSARCARDREVTLITVEGAGHQWPGSLPPAPIAGALLQLDPPSNALDTTQVLWTFFASHRT